MHSYLYKLSEHIMAVIQIPMGGGVIGIDVPDFAMEATQQEILALQRQQLNLANNSVTSQNQISNSINNQTQTINKNDSNEDRRQAKTAGLLSGFVSRAGSVSESVSSIETDSKASATVEKMLSSINLAGLGAGLGTVVGIFEEFGNQMSNFGRIGANIGMNLLELRESSASIGLGLDQLSKVVGESGPMISSLGRTTQEGTNRFIKFTGALRKATESAGFFGMTSAEMAQYTADELELRRKSFGVEYNRNLLEADLAEQLKENINLQYSMARLNGQDVQDRLKAQQDFRKDAINAGIMSSLNEDQNKALLATVSGLSALGGAGSMITEGLRAQVAGMGAEMAPGFAEFASIMGAQGVDVTGAIRRISDMVQSGASTEEVTAATDALAAQVRSVDPKALVHLAIAGVDGAQVALQARMEAVTSGEEHFLTALENLTKSLNDVAKVTAAPNNEMQIMGIQANTEQFMAGTKAQVVNGILGSLGIDPTNVGQAAGQMAGFAKSMADLPNDPEFQKLIALGATFQMTMSGATAVTQAVTDLKPPVGGNAGTQAATIAALGATAIGQNGLADVLMTPMKAANLLNAGITLSSISGFTGVMESAAETMKKFDMSGFTGGLDSASDALKKFIDALRNPIPQIAPPPQLDPRLTRPTGPVGGFNPRGNFSGPGTN